LLVVEQNNKRCTVQVLK